ncbi:MAG TPA: S41 family peptidase, partial [Candidatus Saccharimonadales bacterium]|nr:S41 family peptidase [Candidatus Saccharimonadales bacterium]
ASEGDLWKVPVEGGDALRLTAHEGDERFPRLSPDGRWVAFTAQYDGNDEVYVMPARGGEPVRLTWHPAADQTLGWTQDGRILFRSRRDHPHGDFRIFTVGPAGGIPAMLPLEPAAWIAFEPGGRRIAVQKFGLEFHNWKRYQGGRAEQIYVGTLDPLAFTQVTTYTGKNAFPMWAADGRIYFVTDRWGRPNLASMKPDGSDVKRLTDFEDYDVRWPAMGDGKIVYQHQMDLWVYDLATGRNERVPVQLPSDRLQVREKFVDPMANLGAWGLSKDGERIALETRGDLFVTRTHKKGLIRRITESSLSRTKFPAFSPDGKWLAAWTEVVGEEQLLLHPSDNGGPPKRVGSVPPGWHFGPVWSPDGRKLAWSDQTYRLYVTDVATGATSVADSARFEITEYRWSPDSRYLAYAACVSFQAGLGSTLDQVRIRDCAAGRNYEVTDPMVNSFSPAWDPEGKYLYFLADRFVDPLLDRPEAGWVVDRATLPCVLSLQADGRLPFAPRSDLEPGAGAKKEEAGAKGGGKEGGKEAPAPVRIDFAGLRDRLVEVPVRAGNFAGLRAVEGKLHWLSFENQGLMPPDDEQDDGTPAGDLFTYDIANEKLSKLAPEVLAYDVSGDGKVLVFQTKQGFVRVEAGAAKAPEGDDAADARVDLGGWTLKVDPRDEWKQMLHEAWRLDRDFFYDPHMHGVDWNGVWKQYGPLADRISSRDDLEDLLGEMFGELNVGHAYHGGGDQRHGPAVGIGTLAADLDYDSTSGFWKIRKIYRGDYPTLGWSSPLARADLRIEPGMWLVAIDGKPLVRGEDYLRRLSNRAGQEVELSIHSAPRLEGARRVVVKPVADDVRIRYASWVRETRAYVAEKSHGQIGYLHLYDMEGLGLREFARDYPPQWDRRGLIIDDRWNHGGEVAAMLVDYLARRNFAVSGMRYPANYSTTPDRIFGGHLDVLINRQGGSDCETFAQAVKDFKLGTVIGTRTWGGWVGIRDARRLRDGGYTTQPEMGGWDPQGKAWTIEGHGVDPDVELDLGPDGLMNGHDTQLDYAIQDLLRKIEKDPRDLPGPPPIRPRPLVPVR